MKTLYKWYITIANDGYVAHGVVYGHSSPLCADGTTINTSLIESADFDGDMIILSTLNSEYRLSISEMDCEGYNAAMSLRIFEGFARKFGIMRCFPQVRDHYIELGQWIWDSRKAVFQRLRNNSLYIELSDDSSGYFRMAVYRDRMGEMEFVPYPTDVGDPDGLLVVSVSSIVDYIPYDGGNIEFCSRSGFSFPDKSWMGMIRNSGRRALNIRFSWGKTVIVAPESEIEVCEGMGVSLPLTCNTQDDI